jgi:hypothetical protein
MKHDNLIRRLCEASEGSAELSVAVCRALTDDSSYEVGGRDGPECGRLVTNDAGHRWWTPAPCLTTSISAAWEEAERRGYNEIALTLCRGRYYSDVGNDDIARVSGECRTPALALCAALLAAEGER